MCGVMWELSVEIANFLYLHNRTHLSLICQNKYVMNIFFTTSATLPQIISIVAENVYPIITRCPHLLTASSRRVMEHVTNLKA